MPNSATFTGPAGEIRWAYHKAAVLGAWTLTSGESGRVLVASIQTVDDMRVTQRPLSFVVARPNGRAWKWPVSELQIAGGTLTARLGPQEC